MMCIPNHLTYSTRVFYKQQSFVSTKIYSFRGQVEVSSISPIISMDHADPFALLEIYDLNYWFLSRCTAKSTLQIQLLFDPARHSSDPGSLTGYLGDRNYLLKKHICQFLSLFDRFRCGSTRTLAKNARQLTTTFHFGEEIRSWPCTRRGSH